MGTKGILTVFAILALASACAPPGSSLVVADGVDPVSAAVIRGTWQEFVEFAGTRAACFRSTSRGDIASHHEPSQLLP